MAIKFFFSWKSPLSYNSSACLFVPKNMYFFFKRKFIFLWEQLLGSLPQKGNRNVSPAFWRNVFLSRNLCPIIEQNRYEGRGRQGLVGKHVFCEMWNPATVPGRCGAKQDAIMWVPSYLPGEDCLRLLGHLLWPLLLRHLRTYGSLL